MCTLTELQKEKIVAIVRGVQEDAVAVARALAGGGIRWLEFTAETPGIVRIIEKVSQLLGKDVIVGAGTVLDSETARICLMAGAKFIVSPNTDEATIRMTKRYGALSFPGAFTPTEILRAYEAGADVVKVFPARTLGPAYFKDVAGPLGHIPLMATGGVTLENAVDYLQHATAVGVGGALVRQGVQGEAHLLQDVTEKAKRWVKIVKEVSAY